MKYSFQAAILAAYSCALTACGGSSANLTPSGGLTPAPSQHATTNAAGMLVDDASNAPLSGVKVALMAWSPNSTPTPVAVTDSQGRFNFTAPNGHYLLVIGSDSATDTRATVHDNVTLKGGSQPLAAPTEWPMPTITPKPSEMSGAYRLMTLDPVVQTPCLQAVNSARASMALSPLVPDEWLEENSKYANEAQNNLNETTFAGTLPTRAEDQDNGAPNCSAWIQDTVANQIGAGDWYQLGMLSAPHTLWYGGAFTIILQNKNYNVGWEEWGFDPRVDTPCGSPSSQSTPEGNGCDPSYETWP
jgi:hypothetical protein